MKKTMKALVLVLALLLPSACTAEGTVSIDGRIEAVRTQTIAAPHTGIAGDFAVRAGDELAAGDTLFTLSATPVYADFDGTVTGLFAQAGDSTASVQARYGALCYMEREHLYTVDCSTTGAASDNENKIIHIGEKVYIRSSNNNARKGEAVVTGVSGRSYTLEVTYEEDLRLNEQVKVYRESSFDGESCIGTGRLSRVDPQGVTAEGYVRSVHVQDGQKVRRGDLLFEVVPDALEGMQGGDGSVCMPVDGVLLSVMCESGAQIAKDAPMATFCEKEDMQLVCEVDEEDLALLAVGMQLTVTLDAFPDAPFAGTVERIAAAGTQAGSSASFDVIIGLEENENVRVGMSATAKN